MHSILPIFIHLSQSSYGNLKIILINKKIVFKCAYIGMAQNGTKNPFKICNSNKFTQLKVLRASSELNIEIFGGA